MKIFHYSALYADDVPTN